MKIELQVFFDLVEQPYLSRSKRIRWTKILKLRPKDNKRKIINFRYEKCHQLHEY